MSELEATVVSPKAGELLAVRITEDNFRELAKHFSYTLFTRTEGKTAIEAWPGDPLPIFEGEWVVASEDGVDVTAYSNDEFQRTYTAA
jgi:hypothetical protein|nr:MAG TPA: PGDYG protein [Caudoviricetes sp.]